jgi:hypothetical protein
VARIRLEGNPLGDDGVTTLAAVLNDCPSLSLLGHVTMAWHPALTRIHTHTHIHRRLAFLTLFLSVCVSV